MIRRSSLRRKTNDYMDFIAAKVFFKGKKDNFK